MIIMIQPWLYDLKKIQGKLVWERIQTNQKNKTRMRWKVEIEKNHGCDGMFLGNSVRRNDTLTTISISTISEVISHTVSHSLSEKHIHDYNSPIHTSAFSSAGIWFSLVRTCLICVLRLSIVLLNFFYISLQYPYVKRNKTHLHVQYTSTVRIIAIRCIVLDLFSEKIHNYTVTVRYRTVDIEQLVIKFCSKQIFTYIHVLTTKYGTTWWNVR